MPSNHKSPLLPIPIPQFSFAPLHFSLKEIKKVTVVAPTSTMRMSCNGCRVLRKGCSEDCSIKPCLRWLKTPDSQSHATLFLAKFYGRAGLINLINATPENLRAEVFRSLLYDACGRIVNPVYGSAGLLGIGRWDLCQAAVQAVLSGEPIKTISSASSDSSSANPKGCDIRHVSKGEGLAARDHHQLLHKVSNSSKSQFKRSASKVKPKAEPSFEFMSELAVSHDSVVSWKQPSSSGEADDVSVETVEGSLAGVDEPTASVDGIELNLELTL